MFRITYSAFDDASFLTSLVFVFAERSEYSRLTFFKKTHEIHATFANYLNFVQKYHIYSI